MTRRRNLQEGRLGVIGNPKRQLLDDDDVVPEMHVDGERNDTRRRENQTTDLTQEDLGEVFVRLLFLRQFRKADQDRHYRSHQKELVVEPIILQLYPQFDLIIGFLHFGFDEFLHCGRQRE